MAKLSFLALSKPKKVKTEALRYANAFKNQGVREYFVQHINDDFELIQHTDNKAERAELLAQMTDLKDILKRQSLISNMFYDDARRIGDFTGFKV